MLLTGTVMIWRLQVIKSDNENGFEKCKKNAKVEKCKSALVQQKIASAFRVWNNATCLQVTMLMLKDVSMS